MNWIKFDYFLPLPRLIAIIKEINSITEIPISYLIEMFSKKFSNKCDIFLSHLSKPKRNKNQDKRKLPNKRNIM